RALRDAGAQGRRPVQSGARRRSRRAQRRVHDFGGLHVVTALLWLALGADEGERQVYELMIEGKVAWDKGDYAGALEKWEALSALARAKKNGEPQPAPPISPAPLAPSSFTLSGSVTGGGPAGPGGAVVYLKRLDAPTPRPKAGRLRTVAQKDKRFE